MAKKDNAPPKGDNSIAKAQLRGYFESIERLNEQIEALNADKSEVYQEAKANGYDTTVMRVVLSRRKMDQNEVAERDALIELYERALAGSRSGTKSATRARARGDDEEDGDE